MKTTAEIAQVTSQRADLTYKQNIQHGRHGWLRLTPAYSVKLVDQILAEFGDGARSVFEPFSGTGTTPLCAAYRGIRAVAIDINPFLVWLGGVKCARYSSAQRVDFQNAAQKIVARLQKNDAHPADPPPLKNIERWWHSSELSFITHLRGEIEREIDCTVRDLLKVAFCRTMISLSNAAFNHQSMSFKNPDVKIQLSLSLEKSGEKFVNQFLSDVRTVANSVIDNPNGNIRIEKIDARDLTGLDLSDGLFDLLITSPPYPNRMSYIRELRPYMYWLGFLCDAKEAGELDWEAIGGTWGQATSRLVDWKPKDAFIPDYFFPIVDKIRAGNNKNGALMAQYVHKYFEDIFFHFQAASKIVRPGGSAHYIIGNSTFYGHLVPAERLYCDQLLEAGFKNAKALAIRKRNSKKELIEFHVIASR
jgi:DNA modification methylase